MKTTVFVDSSVFFSAVYSPTGGSSKLFTLHNVSLIAATIVLAEVERNVRKKLTRFHMDRFHMLVKKLSVIEQLPEKAIVAAARRVIVEKDAVILALAKQAQTEYIVTLDRRDFFQENVLRFVEPKQIVTPKMLLMKHS